MSAKPSVAPIARRIRDECLASPLRRLSRVVNAIYDEALRPIGLTVAQLNLLAAIAGLDEDATAARIARALEIEKSTLSRDLARLEAGGLVRRREGGREKRLELTARGAKLLEAAVPAWERAQARAAAALPSLPLLARTLREEEPVRRARPECD
ncbi:MarR family winged helix-turn-helix transcriptional regulator [Sandaracinus amylolyticus]|uniref:MarR family winged helix-turn-helix transcriptional regulator n=1 Tax=Sandaracinus amylolyticus TaxID=927083 RepID=UPI001F2991F5|nr:MarR family transcriptional regulator [Sandaracinus amylolyticus]